MNAFNCKLISTFSADRVYRVFLVPEGTFFIQIGGQNLGQAMAMHFGLLGGLVYSAIEKRSRAKLEQKIQKLDLVHPSAHLGSGTHNFHAMNSDVEISILQPRARYRGHGPHSGRWIFKVRGQKEMTLELETPGDMQKAYDLLPAAIAVHANKVVWNPSRSTFTALP